MYTKTNDGLPKYKTAFQPGFYELTSDKFRLILILNIPSRRAEKKTGLNDRLSIPLKWFYISTIVDASQELSHKAWQVAVTSGVTLIKIAP